MLEEIKDYALKNNIPIMEDEGINFLTNYIKKNNLKTILEIGTAIGYSAIKMAMIDNNIKITSIERDLVRYNEAINNINKMNLKSQINLINNDALEVTIDEKYDLIFIDAAKSQYINFFEKFKNNLNENGVIITDNINFHGLTNSKDETLSKNVKGIIRKLNNYIDFLNNNNDFITEFINIGDGLAISIFKTKTETKK